MKVRIDTAHWRPLILAALIVTILLPVVNETVNFALWTPGAA